jgi:polyhydroxyalkanoate synthesis regulator phasin
MDQYKRDQLREEREFLTRQLESLQSKRDIASLKDMLEIKKHIEELNREISESYNHSSSKKV